VVSVTPRPYFTPGKDPVPVVQEAGWAPGPVWTGAENLAPFGVRSPDRPARSQSRGYIYLTTLHGRLTRYKTFNLGYSLLFSDIIYIIVFYIFSYLLFLKLRKIQLAVELRVP
jgi:hypothetical protein